MASTERLSPAQARWRSTRAWLTLLLCLVGFGVFAAVGNHHYPIKDWLFWDLTELWFWTLLFSAACASFGYMVLRRGMKLCSLSTLESAVLGMAVGVVCFVLALYVAGAFGALNVGLAVVLPVLMLVFGGYDGYALMRQLIVEARESRVTPLASVAAGFGVLYLALVYLTTLTPDAVNFDSSWYHLVISQDYARTHRIVPFYGNIQASVPQLASLIYAWGFLVPGLGHTHRLLLALHLEFGLFVWTLVGVSAAVKRLVGDYSVRSTWAALFLFPSVLIYDSNLGASADHVMAFFAVPIVLAMLNAYRSFTTGNCVMLAFALAGAALTKYQAIYIALPAGVLMLVPWLRALHQLRTVESTHVRMALRRRIVRAPLVVLGVSLVLVSPHFIRNIIFHHNPFFPLMQNVFTHSFPKTPEGKLVLEHLVTDTNWVPTGTLLEKFVHATKLFFTFSFESHYTFTKYIPVFGSLFTLLLPAVFLVPQRKNVLLVAAVASGAVFLWAITFNVDRNLQTFMPIMAAVVGALIVKLWRLGTPARIGLVPLILLQVVWGSDAVFYSGEGKLHRSMELITSGYNGRVASRFTAHTTEMALTAAIPENAKVILHSAMLNLGIDRDVILDCGNCHDYVRYAASHTPRELYDYYRSLGITYIIMVSGESYSGPKDYELLLHTLIARYGVSSGQFGSYHLYKLPNTPPPAEPAYQVLALGVGGYGRGLYAIENMGTIEQLPGRWREYKGPDRPINSGNWAELIAAASAVLMRSDDSLSSELRPALQADFEPITNWRTDTSLYVRKIRH